MSSADHFAYHLIGRTVLYCGTLAFLSTVLSVSAVVLQWSEYRRDN